MNEAIERVYYKHYRYHDVRHPYINQAADGYWYEFFPDGLCHYTRGKTKWQPTCKGGRTECYLVLDNGQEIMASAKCSHKDNFVYKIGRQIAYGRAMKLYQHYLRDKADYENTMRVFGIAALAKDFDDLQNGQSVLK